MVLIDDIAQHVPVGKAEQSQVMNLSATEGLHAKSYPCLKAKCSYIGAKAFPNVPLPDAQRLGAKCLRVSRDNK